LLKEELRRLGSLLIACADACKVDAGGALAVDRQAFSQMVTEKLTAHPLIAARQAHVEKIPAEGPVIIATGPLTDGPLAQNIVDWLGEEQALSFYDAAAPIVSAASLDMDKAYFASRYGKGTGFDYINCPMSREQYLAFWRELCQAEQAPVHGFEDQKVFEGCMPVEVMARRGEDTLRYGPMKPVGLPDPRTGEEPYAVVQLRRENSQGTMFNLVGFQTHLRFPEQKRVLSMIPGLERAEFLRYGVMHRNSYLPAKDVLLETYQSRLRPDLFFAGQLTGVEGYVESAASGLAAGINMARVLQGREPVKFGRQTALGAQAHYIANCEAKNLQPMNANFGIMVLEEPCHKRERKAAFARQSARRIREIREMLRAEDGEPERGGRKSAERE